MAASAGPSIGHTTSPSPQGDNPFAVPGVRSLSQPRLPTPDLAMGFQHGSLEQTGARSFLGTYLDSLDERQRTPTRSARTLPRSPSPRRGQRRNRSREDESRRSRERSRDGEDEHPVGMGFRLTACETSLKDHYGEISAHRITIQQLHEAVGQLTVDRDAMRQRLDDVFGHVDVKFTEAQTKIQNVTDVANEIARGAFDRFQSLENKWSALQTEMKKHRQ